MIWKILGISPTRNIKEIKQAYAKLAKKYNPEEYPEEFQKIFDAYKSACAYAKNARNTEISNTTDKNNEDLSKADIDSSEKAEPDTAVKYEYDFSDIDPYKKNTAPLSEKNDELDFSDIDVTYNSPTPKETDYENEHKRNNTNEFDFSKVNDKYDESDEQRRLIFLRITLKNQLAKLTQNGSFIQWNTFFEQDDFSELANDYEFRLEASKILNGRPFKKDIAHLISEKFPNSTLTVMNFSMGLYQVFIPVKNNVLTDPPKKPSVFLITLIIVILAFTLIPILFTRSERNNDNYINEKNANSIITLRPYENGEDVNEYLNDAMIEISENTSFNAKTLYKLCVGKWNFEFGSIEFLGDNTFKSSFYGKEITGTVSYSSTETGPGLNISFSAPDTAMDNSKASVRFLFKDSKAMVYKLPDGTIAIGNYIEESE